MDQTPPEKMSLEETIEELKASLRRYSYSKREDKILKSALTHLEGAQADKGWQPISTAPKDCVTILTIHRDDLYPVAAFLVGDVWLREIEGPEDVPYTGKNEPLRRVPTHWMPLPEPPVSAMAAQTEGEQV